MLPKQSHLSMRRIVIIAVAAIILPSLVLTLVGLKLTLNLKSQLERSLADQYASSAGAKVEEIEAHIAAVEERVKHSVHLLEPDRILPALSALRRDTPLVEDLFLLEAHQSAPTGTTGQRLGMLYPLPPKPTVADTLLWTEPIPRIPEPAARPAADDGPPPAERPDPLDALRRYRSRTLSPAARLRATQAIAAAHFRGQRYAEAAAEYRRMLDADSAAVLSPSLALLARYQIALAHRRLDKSREAVDAFLALYADLVTGATRVADRARTDYFKRRVSEDLEPLLARPDMPRALAERYRALRQENEARGRRTRFLAYVRRYVLPRLELQAQALSPEDEGFRHLWDDQFADEPYVIAYAAVRGHDRSRRILGLKLSIAHVRGVVLPEALRTSRFGPRLAFVVADRKGGEPLFGDPGGKPFAASKAFPAIFRSWRLGLVERQPARLRSLALRNVYLFAFVTSAMILAIIIGVVITLRGTAHELELSRLKSDFVDNVSHELKTPLALIRMFGETLAMGRIRSPDRTQEYYGIIARESERLTQLINNVLDFSRIEGGRKTYELRLDDLADVIRDTLHAYSYELAKEGFEVDTDIPDELPATLLDRNAISLAVLNLLSNAVKYSGDDRRIRVACLARNGALCIEVQDHGIGIARDDLEKIFEKFYRARSDVVAQTRGSGLGLAIVRHSVEAHGGTIGVTSERGKGSTFTITLPIRKTLSDGKDPGR